MQEHDFHRVSLAVQGKAIDMEFLGQELKERNLDMLFNEISTKQ